MATTGLLPPKNYISAFDPRSIEGCTLWIDASDPACYTKNDATGVVTQIFDKTGVNTIDFSTGNDWRVDVQTGTVKFNGRPVFVNTAGGPSTSKLGTISGQTINTSTISDITLNVVYTSFVANTGTTTANGMLFDSTNNIGVGVMSNGMLGIHNGTNVDQTPPTNFSPVRPPVLSPSSGTRVVFPSGGFGSIQIGFGRTIIETSNSLIPTTFGSEITIGGNIGGTVPWVGCIAEIICHQNTLTFDQQLQIDGYLYAKWGGSLATTHPYMSTTFKSRVPPFLRPFFPPNEIGDVKCLFWFDASDASTVSGSGTSMIWTDKSGNGNNITAWSGGTQTYSSNRAMTLPAGSIGTIVNNIALTSQTAYSGFAVLTWPTSANAPHDGRGIYLRPISTSPVTSTTGLAFGVNRMWYGAPIVTYTAGDPAAPIKYVTITTASGNGVPFQTAFAGNPTSTGGLTLGGLNKVVVGERLPTGSLTMSSAATGAVVTTSTSTSGQSAGTTNNLYTNRLPYFTDIDPSFGTTLTGGQMSQGGTAIQTFACAPTALTKVGTTAASINPMEGTKLVVMWSRDTDTSASSSVNGSFSTIATGSHRASTAAQTYRIGNPVTTSTTAGQLTTGVTYDLHEVMFFDSSITSYTYKKIEAYLAHKWGTVNTSSNAALNTFNSGPLGPFYKFPPQVVTPFNPITTRSDPSSLDNSLVAWYDASDSGAFTFSGANVSTWKDKSGNTADWTMSSPSTNVVRSSGTLVNGIPTVVVTAGGNSAGQITNTLTTGASDVTIFISMCATGPFPSVAGECDILTTGGSSLALQALTPANTSTFTNFFGAGATILDRTTTWSVTASNTLNTIINISETNRNSSPTIGSLIQLKSTSITTGSLPTNKAFIVTAVLGGFAQRAIKAIVAGGMTVSNGYGTVGTCAPAARMYFAGASGKFGSEVLGLTVSYAPGNPSKSVAVPNIYSTSIAGTSATNFKDGSAGTTTSVTSFLYNGTSWSFLSGLSVSGNVNEILFFNRTLTTFQRQQIEGYLAWKWGSNSLLATTHPYYKIRP